MPLPFDATPATLGLALFGALCLGVSKTGFPGLAIVNVMLVAELFGAKNSVGIILPMLVVCDLVVLPLFWRHASWKQVWPLVPVTFAAIVGAWVVLSALDDLAARRVIGGIILFMLALQLLREFRKAFLEHLPDSPVFRWFSCALIGVSTMLANAAGPVYSIYALVHKMPKMEFLGIGARLFLLVNLFKLPFLGQLELDQRPVASPEPAPAPRAPRRHFARPEAHPPRAATDLRDPALRLLRDRRRADAVLLDRPIVTRG